MLNRRSFCFSALSLPAMMTAAKALGPAEGASAGPAVWNSSHAISFRLDDNLEHPFYWWPRTLLTYPIEFHSVVDLQHLQLIRTDTGEQIPIQFSDIVKDAAGVQSATLNFFSDLPSGGHREFRLSAIEAPASFPAQVSERREDNTIVLDSGVMQVRIPASQDVRGEAPGPILQVSRGGHWVGSSTLDISDGPVTRITASRVEDGPLLIIYELVYETEAGSRYVARVHCNAGLDFVRLHEDMEGLRPGVKGTFTSTWTGFDVTNRQAPNHPYPSSGKIHPYDEYLWETIAEPWVLRPAPLLGGELPFKLGIYQTWTAFTTGTFGNFWDNRSGDALGVFVDKADDWQDHEYTDHVESPSLQVSYFYLDGKFFWTWPLTRGTRSTCIAWYDHAKDKEAMHRLEQDALGVQQGGFTYSVGLIFASYAHFLQNRYGTLDLNCIKDWVLDYSDDARRPPVVFSTGSIKTADELEQRVMAGPYVCTLPVNGTRQNGGAGPIPGRSIVNFSPVPSRQVQGWWVDGFNRMNATMTPRQRKRLTAIYLFMAYVCQGDDFMPMVPMLSGHPNFLADVKGVPAAMSFLFPDHPMASTWADFWEKYVEINTRYNTRPAVKAWDAYGGRWTENLGTYVWAFLRPSLRSDFLLRQYDKVERFITPQLATMADWLVNALTAPFDGETPEAYHALQTLDDGHQWGALLQGNGPRRIHPPQGAHSERRVPPRTFWYFGTGLQRFAPIQAEHVLWAARPTDQDTETAPGAVEPWDDMYRVRDNLGTNPHLSSRKYTGYGVILRSAVDTPAEVSIHLQQIDEGPNYRWGRAGEGGCGVIYFVAAGKDYSYNASEDVGDRDDEDTDFCTSFAVFKDGEFRSIGMNVLSRPFYNLGAGQFAQILPRQGPGAYSAPEYVSRSVLLSGHDYFVVYDRVLNETISHRLSWFVRRGSELPTIKLIRGFTTAKESQRTDIQTAASTGVWFDGPGDSMAVVSHRKDIEVVAAHFGCRVHAADIDDIVFQNPEPVHFVEGPTIFDGTAGLIRKRENQSEFALFHGTRIGLLGWVFSTTDTDLGIGGIISNDKPASGEYYAPRASSISITMPGLSEKTVFYIDGKAVTDHRESGTLHIELEQGSHHWELTETLPVPMSTRVERTENRAGGARIIVTPVDSASHYRFELSRDSGATWTKLGESAQPQFDVNGLSDGIKVHIRATALNSTHQSAPGPEYPLYVTKQPPPPPDGLRVDLAQGAATITWGEILGVTEYRLYARTPSARKFVLIYHGLERSFENRDASIRLPNANPNDTNPAKDKDIIEYYVSAVNGNGEGPRSRSANTDPASWRNWDPKPGEPFRRDFYDDSPSASIKVNAEWPHYYPK